MLEWLLRWFRRDPDREDEASFVRYQRIDLGPPKQGHENRPDWGIRESKIFSALVNETSASLSVAEYISSVSDISFQLRDSEYLYNSEYLSGSGNDIQVTIVPAVNLQWLPLRLRRPGWVYVSITCGIDDTRFDTLPGYEMLPIRKHLKNA